MDSLKSNRHKLVIEYTSDRNVETDSLVQIISSIAILGNDGHTFSVILDPHEKYRPNGEVDILWDGDGIDYIKRIVRDDVEVSIKQADKIFNKIKENEALGELEDLKQLKQLEELKRLI